MAQEEMRVKKSTVKVSIQEAKRIFPFFSHPLSSYFRPCGDNEGLGFVNIISGILQLPSAYLWPEF